MYVIYWENVVRRKVIYRMWQKSSSRGIFFCFLENRLEFQSEISHACSGLVTKLLCARISATLGCNCHTLPKQMSSRRLHLGGGCFFSTSGICLGGIFFPWKGAQIEGRFLNIGLKLRGNIVRTANLQWAQLTKTVHTARFGLEFVFLCFF